MPLHDSKASTEDDLVVASHAVALKIERHVRKAEALARIDDCVAQIERPREFIAADFDSREGSFRLRGLAGLGKPVPSNAQLPQSQATQICFEAPDLRKPLAGHFGAVRDAAG